MARFRYPAFLLATLIATVAVVAGLVVWLQPQPSAAAKRSRVHTFGPVVTQPQSGRLYAEFERQDALMLGCNELVQFHPQTLVDIVRAIDGRIRIVGLISRPEQERQVLELLQNNSVATNGIEFFLWPAVSMWVQDFGPIMLVDDETRIVDFSYSFTNRDLENQLNVAFAAKYGLKISNCGLSLEGGNLLVNGRGNCFTTSIVADVNVPRGYDVARIGSILNSDFRLSHWTVLPPLAGEPTGHIDMFLTIVNPTTVVLGRYQGADDATNTMRLEKCAEILASARVDDQPLTVLRVPMPSRHDDKWRTYTNVLFANGVLLVPQYPDYCPDLDAEALEIYRRAMPDWEVVGIDSSSLIEKRGSLHCVSRSLPQLPLLDAE